MKPPPFEYAAPDSMEAALALLQQHGEDAKLLAGGQSLIPAMNFRLLAPTALVDLNRITDLSYIRPAESGGVLIGAMTRQGQVERSALVADRVPLLYETVPFIAHPQIRNRGTVGGSLVHADPAAELPVICTVMDARFRARGPQGDRWIEAGDFFQFLFTTALEADEILVEIELPALPANSGAAFLEFSRRRGDYALLGAAAVVTVDEDGVCQDARLAYLNAGDVPMRADAAAGLLVGQVPTDELFAEVGETASVNEIEPMGTLHATPEYQRHLARVLTRRVLNQAFARANGA